MHAQRHSHRSNLCRAQIVEQDRPSTTSDGTMYLTEFLQVPFFFYHTCSSLYLLECV